MIKTISWITVAITLFSSQLTAQEMLGYTIHAPPLNFVLTPKQGEPGEPEITGFTTDVIKEIFHRTRDIVNIEIIPWARAYRNAKTVNNNFIFSIARTAKREAQFKWVGPIARKKARLFAKSDSLISINSLADAKKVASIGTMREDSKEQYLKQQGFTNLQSTTHWEQGLGKLLLGRTTLFAATDLDIQAISREAQINPHLMKAVFTMYGYNIYIGFSQLTSDRLIARWQAALDDMKNDGSFQKLVDKWAAYYQAPNWEVKDGMLQVE
ncbi:substrate-binding periplasmic protein [Agarivorans sp. Z349TD_8]|uniref:substrate-binding periplasmic protein n=1 Tax=Agarivorans sp. Z349TD_8 TaxID=3421434 RepID=UPI003D7C98B5